METVGQKFKKARQEKNISLEQAQNATKIQINILRSFEEDNFNNKLGTIYVKSLLKLYAKFLGLDYLEIIKQAGFEEQIREKNILQQISPQAKERMAFKFPAIKLPKIKKKTIIIVLIAAAVYVFGLLLVKAITSSKSKNVSEVKKVAALAVKVKKEEDRESVKEVKKQAVVELQPIQLGIRAKSDCWLRVVVDGNVLFRDVLKKNNVESWQAKKIIELSVADATRLEIEVNGKIIGPLGRKGQAVKDIKITSEGITVGK